MGDDALIQDDTPILNGGTLSWCYDTGTLRCYDAMNGGTMIG